MASRVVTLLVILAVTSGGFFGARALTKNPCTTTKTWSLGPIDPRFGLSERTIVQYGEEATKVWNDAYGNNPLFSYKESGGDITLTFIYDERQRTTIQNERLKRSIDQEKTELKDIKQTIESLRAEYASLEKQVASLTSSYNARLAKHNKEVAYWNERGGAPTDVYQRLQRERATLETERVTLNQKINRFNQVGAAIRQYGQDHNEIVGTINEKVATLNDTALQEFEEGTYNPNNETITIYEYGSVVALKRVLIHEFGHALGLGHVDQKEAIMYPINQGKTLGLGDEDKTELAEVCRDKNLQDLKEVAVSIRDGIFHLAGWSLSDRAAQAE